VGAIRRLVKRIRERVPDTPLRYLSAFVALAVITALAYLLIHFHAPRSTALAAVLWFGFFAIILGSAWLGYGPGLMVCVLTSFVVTRVIAPNPRNAQANVTQFATLVAISLLVSRVSEVSRRHEAVLRRAAVDLEKRVRERTADAVEAANAVREQAQLLELAHDAILSIDWNGTISFWNRGAEQMYGWSKEEAIGKISHELLHTVFPEPLEAIGAHLAAAGYWEGELQHTRRDGAVLRVVSRWALRQGREGRPAGYLEINTDVTERRQMEEQLRHRAKLESLGVLAGGVAHDFNNLLTGILGNASLALDSTPAHHPSRLLLEEVMRASERAADLTRQLLAYAGKGRFVMRVVDLSGLVREISGLVQTSIPKPVQLRLQLAEDLPGIEADAGQLQQIVMNLVINGAEAIGPDGGTVLVRTGTQAVDEQYIRAIAGAGDQLRPGPYVMLEVHDTGSGMSPETLAKIFDPFFTTKFTGRGLGLSAVQGIVRAHRGALKVYSQPGQGTTFKVLFPASAHVPTPVVAPAGGDLTGHGTVLVVDDEDIVRQTARHTLERYGYKTIAARHGAEALEVYRRSPDRISLVLLDLTMPVMSGEQTLREMQTIRPAVRVLLTSGYNEVEAVQRFAGKGLAGFIQKPYTSIALAEKVKQALV
jgi:PAS domain S-box-containing protein